MEHLDWGLQMTVLGMGLVFSMLALLWLLLTIVLKFDKEEVEQAAPTSEEADDVEEAEQQEEAHSPAAVIGTPPPSGSEDLVAAIAMAVTKHRAQGVPAGLAAVITIAAIEHRKAVGGGPVARSFWPGTQPIRWTPEARERARQTNHWN